MADISMCDDTNCPSRGQCHRYCAWPSKALGERRADMTDSLFNAIVSEVVAAFTPVRDPGHGHGTND